MQKIACAAGDTILTVGEEGRTAFLVMSGVVESSWQRRQSQTRRGPFGRRSVGEVSLLGPGSRSATVGAISQVECAVTSYDDFVIGVALTLLESSFDPFIDARIGTRIRETL
jgi:CRP/FNR family transcriptional regulator, cyclic AMP receptor protein